MKSRNIIAAGALALACAGYASAETLYITGSTAYRSQTITAILTLLGASSPGAAGATLPAGGGYIWENSNGSTTDVHKANAAVFKGTYNGSPLTVKCSWSGSAAGIQTVANSTTTSFKVRFLPTDTETNAYTVPTNGTGTNLSGGNPILDPRKGTNANVAATADVAMSDCYQFSTPFIGSFLGETYQDLSSNEDVVGVVTFQWVRSKTTPTSVANMTPQLARALFSLGSLPLSFWTGNAADTALVYATGRDADSGTRVTAFAESGVGVNSSVQQYDTSAATEPALYAQQTINGVVFAPGQGGEASGGTLGDASHMGKSTTKYYVSYMSIGDANTLSTNCGTSGVTNSDGTTGQAMTYNGAVYSATAVKEGKYAFWGYEHLFTRPGLAAPKSTFAADLVTTIQGAAETTARSRSARCTPSVASTATRSRTKFDSALQPNCHSKPPAEFALRVVIFLGREVGYAGDSTAMLAASRR